MVTRVLALALVVGIVGPVQSAEPSARQLIPPGASVILEIRQPQIVFQHALVKRILPIIQQSRAYQDVVGNPDWDLVRDSIQHYETELGLSLPQIVEACAGESLLLAAKIEQPPLFAAVMTGRDADRVSKLPGITLSLARKIVAGRGQNLPSPVAKTYGSQGYFQFGEIFYSVVGKQWLLANRETTLQAMLDRLDPQKSQADTGIAVELARTSSDNPGVRLIADLPSLEKIPPLTPILNWPPPDVAPVILAGGWLDLLQRSGTGIVDVDLGNDSLVASVKLLAEPQNLTPGTVGFFASEPKSAAAPLLEPPHTIYSASWYRDYTAMWDNREKVPLPEQIKRLEMQIKSVETGNLGYSGFDIIRLIGSHHRVVVTRPGPNPYRVELTDRLPAFGLVLDVRDEKQFKDKVLFPIQRIIGIVAVTNKMVIQTINHQMAEISALRFTEDPASVESSDRVRYNFEPSYSVTRGHLVVGSTSHLVKSLIDDLDRIAHSTPDEPSTAPGLTERQILELGELSQVLTDVHGLAVRNAVLNDGLTIAEAESELSLVQQVIAAIGQLQVHAGFGEGGFEYRIDLHSTNPGSQ